MALSPCRDSVGRPKAVYASQAAARRALRSNPKWRLVKEWPNVYQCIKCRAWHLGHGLLQ
jgi:hypothetical protein